ncbi:zinc finger FYVE domain-containing protein 1-like isoform X2 [Rhagoletis pomonella]|uniref:zinc finger FYVE domain-containing protein 1-like isoform X2 n=1 Tax=Rhagoletis pomonella TaxID=28610 RepID=UPI001780249D|nr:zinc finger FYVE domain-containing protein 1-like isoform X2 [Rhagoletis pomonella]XP_036339482.1 zinc finger FYVE domain-containing protein 1-like isoform X2 [Rhagoletis pomonella]
MEKMWFSVSLDENDTSNTNVPISNDFKSIDCCIPVAKYELPDYSTDHSFLLMDAEENLRIPTPELFRKKLKCNDDTKIKVISIFGNTGDGKSHTMNNTFFDGAEVFMTSAEQNSCTIGVYAALQRDMDVLCLDTEGLLGSSKHHNRRIRMLLKILAVSDIVIYRTRSERLHSDMFEFLGSASEAFCLHFAQALQSLPVPGTAQTLGPAVIIFHETQHTNPLDGSVAESAEDQLRKCFERHNQKINAFSSVRYIGIQTPKHVATDYSKLKSAIKLEIANTTVRSPRQPSVVFKAMNALNTKFSGEIVEKSINPFPEQFFTCPVRCEACNQRCQRSMGHLSDGEAHMNQQPCNYQNQYDNKKYLCKICYKNGKENVVTFSTQTKNDSSWSGLAKYAWKGGVIDCPSCGEIYRSRQYWFGNKSPEETSVRSIIVHVWEPKGPSHSAQMVLDRVSTLGEALPKLHPNAVTGWLADWVAPGYWKPNSEIISCHACQKVFENTGLHKHHCRSCGEGFCHACSQKQMPVPARGWSEPVRVCNSCYTLLQNKPNAVPANTTEAFNHTNSNSNSNPNNNITGPPTTEQADISVRKIGEVIINPLGSITKGAYEFTKGIIKDTARPSYWVPDAKAPTCYICETLFGTAEELAIAKANSVISSSSGNSTTTSSPAPKTTKENIVNGNVAAGSSAGNITNGGFNIPSPIGDCLRHHCRRCGQAVCEHCSQQRQPVPEHGWDVPVRVCDKCADLKQCDPTIGQAASGSSNNVAK